MEAIFGAENVLEPPPLSQVPREANEPKTEWDASKNSAKKFQSLEIVQNCSSTVSTVCANVMRAPGPAKIGKMEACPDPNGSRPTLAQYVPVIVSP